MVQCSSRPSSYHASADASTPKFQTQMTLVCDSLITLSFWKISLVRSFIVKTNAKLVLAVRSKVCILDILSVKVFATTCKSCIVLSYT